jgi:hypothetical protein
VLLLDQAGQASIALSGVDSMAVQAEQVVYRMKAASALDEYVIILLS